MMLPAVFVMTTREMQSNQTSTQLKNRTIELYSSHPKLANNSVTKEAKVALGVDFQIPKITNAREQQGLIALYQEMIRMGVRPRQPRLPGM